MCGHRFDAVKIMISDPKLVARFDRIRLQAPQSAAAKMESVKRPKTRPPTMRLVSFEARIFRIIIADGTATNAFRGKSRLAAMISEMRRSSPNIAALGNAARAHSPMAKNAKTIAKTNAVSVMRVSPERDR